MGRVPVLQDEKILEIGNSNVNTRKIPEHTHKNDEDDQFYVTYILQLKT